MPYYGFFDCFIVIFILFFFAILNFLNDLPHTKTILASVRHKTKNEVKIVFKVGVV